MIESKKRVTNRVGQPAYSRRMQERKKAGYEAENPGQGQTPRSKLETLKLQTVKLETQKFEKVDGAPGSRPLFGR